MIFQPFYNSCGRDETLLELSIRLLDRLDERVSAPLVTHEKNAAISEGCLQRLQGLGCTIILRPGGFGDWGWASSLVGIVTLRKAADRLKDMAPEDWLIRLDSDTMIVAPDVLDAVAELEADVEMAGFLQDDPPVTARYGPLLHCGGRCQFIRMSLVRRLARINADDAAEIRSEMDVHNICLFEDVVLSYAAMRAGARIVGLDPHEHECWGQDAGDLLINGARGGSICHIDGFKGPVGGVEITDRAEIPEVLKKLGAYPTSADCGVRNAE